jgi:hypothetical protein
LFGTISLHETIQSMKPQMWLWILMWRLVSHYIIRGIDYIIENN